MWSEGKFISSAAKNFGTASRWVARLLLLCIASVGPAVATPGTETRGSGELCLTAITAAEQAHRLPAQLLRSIAYVESGRSDPVTGRAVPWPWTINAAGRGSFYATREEAVAAARALQAAGVRSFDVGCAQINLMHHPAAFTSLEEAFDPDSNVRYAARFLNALRATTQSWPYAAAAYHSQTQDRGISYARRVMALWPNSASFGSLPPETGVPGPQRGAPADYARYTPAFAAALRRMDLDRVGALRATGARAADTRSIWINRPPEPIPLVTSGSWGGARRLPRGAAG